MARKSQITEPETIAVVPVSFQSMTVRIVGITPLILHAMSAKAKEQLLIGGKKKTAAEKAGSVKHHPYEEFVSGLIRARPDRPTALAFPGSSFKRALAYATRTTSGVTKVDIMSMCNVSEIMVDLYGIPKLRMDVVRSADFRRTPDIRTRPILDRWGCVLTITYVTNYLSAQTIITLLVNAGQIAGIGDWRPERGGPFGKFTVLDASDIDTWSAVEAEGRAAQEAAIAEPEPYDDDTQHLLALYSEIMATRR